MTCWGEGQRAHRAELRSVEVKRHAGHMTRATHGQMLAQDSLMRSCSGSLSAPPSLLLEPLLLCAYTSVPRLQAV